MPFSLTRENTKERQNSNQSQTNETPHVVLFEQFFLWLLALHAQVKVHCAAADIAAVVHRFFVFCRCLLLRRALYQIMAENTHKVEA